MAFQKRSNQLTRQSISLRSKIGKFYSLLFSFMGSLHYSDHRSYPGYDQYCSKYAKHNLASSSFAFFHCKPILFFGLVFLTHKNLVQDKGASQALSIKLTLISYQKLSFTVLYFPILYSDIIKVLIWFVRSGSYQIFINQKTRKNRVLIF